VTMAMADPLSAIGTSAASRRSRMEANSINTSENPSAPPRPKNKDSIKLWLAWAFNRGMPSA
jgi:hypothetical protein